MGRSAEEMCGELLRALGEQATATAALATATAALATATAASATATLTNDGTRLRLVGDRDISAASDEETSS